MPWELLRAAPGGGGAGTGDGLTPPPAPARCGAAAAAAAGGGSGPQVAGPGGGVAAPAPARYGCSVPSGEGSCWPGKPLLPPRSPEHRRAPRPVPAAAVPAAPCPASPAPAWEKRPRRWLGGSDTPGRGQGWAVSSARHGTARHGSARRRPRARWYPLPIQCGGKRRGISNGPRTRSRGNPAFPRWGVSCCWSTRCSRRIPLLGACCHK